MAALRAHAAVTETGDSAFAVRMRMGGHELIGDEPAELGGGGLGPSPYEMLSAALAECTTMTIRWYARQQDWPVERIDVAVTWSRKTPAGATSPVDAFEKTITIHGPELTDDQRARLLNIAAKCPVQRTLESTPSITTLAALPSDIDPG